MSLLFWTFQFGCQDESGENPEMTRPGKQNATDTQGKMCKRVFLFKVNQEALSGLSGCGNLWSRRSYDWKTPPYLSGYSVTHAKQAAGGRTLGSLNKGWQGFSRFRNDTSQLMSHTPCMKGKNKVWPLKNPLNHLSLLIPLFFIIVSTLFY